ncbi:MAG TPA: ATP-dependent DNA helicase RecQ [Polyangiaceae bacterium]|nr:ATP-dependent DNA helicase RecQ [Polyangiaceae bacterium]
MAESAVFPTSATDPLNDVLCARFGLREFRPWQREAIDALLVGCGRVLVVAPTGGGKSLTYQVPAIVLSGTTLVLSPLVALMEDQVRALATRGIAATFLASTLDPSERRQREAAMRRGSYKLVYAAPERLASEAFVEILAASNVSLVAVDEAHCIAQWGHDFRPDYLRIGRLLERLRPARVLACTATATPRVRREIRDHLRLGQDCHEVLRGFARPNLHLSASSVEGAQAAHRAVLHALASGLGASRAPRGAGIVYTATRRGTERWADALRRSGWNAAPYHAGLAADDRTRIASRFADRSLDLVVATNAFGMGIDRADIRVVVHAQPPSSIESYYQEVGRAGRDGAEAYGLLLCSAADVALRRRLVTMGTDGAQVSADVAARAWELFRGLLRYLDARTCRHDFILRYFGDDHETLGGCGHCDACAAFDPTAGPDDSERTSSLVRMALSAVARARGRAGLVAVTSMLRGVDDKRTRRFGFTSLSTFGLMRERSHTWILELMRGLLAAGWIDLTPTEHSTAVLTPEGARIMRSKEAISHQLPPDPAQRPPTRTAAGPKDVRLAGAAPGRHPGRESLDVRARGRFDRLRAHRAEVARARGVPPYLVALDRTLLEMAQRPPRSRAELLEVFGMGPARAESFGDGFLAVLRE